MVFAVHCAVLVGVAELGTSAAERRGLYPEAQFDDLEANGYGFRVSESPEPKPDEVVSRAV